MNALRVMHGIAAVVNGLALAGAIYAPRLSAVCCALSGLLLIGSGEKLRHALETRESRP